MDCEECQTNELRCTDHEDIVVRLASYSLVQKVFGLAVMTFFLTLISISTYTYIDLAHFKNEALKNHDLDGWNMVDLNGAYSGKNFVLKYHGKNGDGSLIGRQKKIESIKQSIEKIGVIINRQEQELAELEKNIKVQSSQSRSLGEELENLTHDLNGVESSLIRNHYSQSQALEILKDFHGEVKDTVQTIEGLQVSIQQLEPGLEKGNAVIENFKSIAQQASDALVKALIASCRLF